MKKQTYTNKMISDLLRDIAAAYLLKNENRFKIVAYENAASTVEHLSREIYDIWQDEHKLKFPGIGPSISSHLDELFRTGESHHFTSVLKEIPAGVFELMKVPGIGPKKAFKLVNTLHLNNKETVLEDLEKAAKRNQIAELETFGEKSQQDILEALEQYKSGKVHTDRMPLPVAYAMAKEIIHYLKSIKGIERADALGSMRRMISTIGDIDIAVAAPENLLDEIIAHFLNYPKKINVENAGTKKASIIIPPNIRVDLAVQTFTNYGSMLQYFTGSKHHNIKLREFALKKGLSLSEHGIKNVKTEAVIECDTEKRFYNYLGLEYIPPEIREGRNEIPMALKHQLPQLVEVTDVKGDFHTHSSYDLKPSHDFGKNTYQEIANYGQKLDYNYIGFSDHNPRMSNLTEDEIVDIMKKRKQHIDTVLKHSPIPYFIGLEVDIQPSGEIALPVKAIDYVDYLIVSIHSSFTQPKEVMTKRVLKALSYPKVKIYGHPTGRKIGKRPGIDLDWKLIFDYVKQQDIALEINSWTDRLDLPDSLVWDAKVAGINRFIVNTDAHANEDMNNMLFGISVARRGWLTKSDIINCSSYDEVKDWINKRGGVNK